jgi:hypothetical protein
VVLLHNNHHQGKDRMKVGSAHLVKCHQLSLAGITISMVEEGTSMVEEIMEIPMEVGATMADPKMVMEAKEGIEMNMGGHNHNRRTMHPTMELEGTTNHMEMEVQVEDNFNHLPEDNSIMAHRKPKVQTILTMFLPSNCKDQQMNTKIVELLILNSSNSLILITLQETLGIDLQELQKKMMI